jgi:signal transduction histidine kinase
VDSSDHHSDVDFTRPRQKLQNFWLRGLRCVAVVSMLALAMFIPKISGWASNTSSTIQKKQTIDKLFDSATQSAIALPYRKTAENQETNLLRSPTKLVTWFEFSPTTGINRYSLYVPSYSGELTFAINDVEFAKLASNGGLLPAFRTDPMLTYIPIDLVKPKTRVSVTLVTPKDQESFLSPIFLGPTELIEQVYERHWNMTNGALITISAVAVVAILFGLFLSLGSGDPVYNRFTWAACFLLLYLRLNSNRVNSPYGWSDFLISQITWFLFLGSMAACIVLMCRQSVSIVDRVIFRVSVLGIILALIVFFFEWVELINYFWFLSLIIASILCMFLIKLISEKSRFLPLSLLGVSILFLVALVIDIDGVVLSSTRRGEPLLTQLACLPMLSVVFLFCFERYFAFSRRMVLLNQSLKFKVQEAEERVRQLYLELGRKERQTAVLGERQRLMKDIHDGIGSQLVSALCLAQATQLNSKEMIWAIENCMTELRLAIDSLDGEQQHLSTVIGDFRSRIEPVMQRSGIELSLSVRLTQTDPYLESDKVRELYRILQEAIANVLKHSNAKRVWIRYGVVGAYTFISVLDSGSPQQILLASKSSKSGHGIRNMRSRAQAMGWGLRIRTGQERNGYGTHARLCWK